MRKYLMTGMAALAISAAFTSCSKDTDVYNKEVIQENTKQTIVNNYNEAFVKTFGQPAANHQWGFVNYAKAGTRDVDVNGNMWETRPELGETEETDVLNYMDMTLAQMKEAGHAYSKNFPVNMPNFFVTQVHTGDDYYGSAQDPNNKNVLGSKHMNELVIAITKSAARPNNSIATNTLPEADSWHHVNNFNAGSSKDWGGNTKFVNMGTCDFAYHNSKDSRFHNRWIVVSGADIDAALGVNKYTGYYYVCFDFQSNVPDQQKDVTKFSCQMKNDSGNWQDGFNGQVDGLYSSAQDIIDAGVTQLYVNGQLVSINDVQNITVTGYEHAHAIIPGDNNYSDWIIRLCAATPGDDVTPGGGSSSSSTSSRTDRIERRRLVSQGRIFCEDLGTDAARMTKSDIDFNDAVFDAKIWRLGQYDVTYVNGSYSSETDYLEGIYDNGLENGKFKYVAEIRLLAAGGTVPLKIGGKYGFEIHSKFGEGNNRTITHTTIINTMGAPSQANFSTTVSTETCDAVTVEVDITSLVAGKSEIGLDIIPIDVEWVSQTGQSVGELTADFGKAPQKLCVPIGTPWVYERIPITDAYKDFAAYATSRTPLFWDGTKNESLLYPSLPEGMTPETGETGNVNTNPYHDRVVTQGTTTTTTVTETVLWEGEIAFENASAGSTSEELTLYSKDFAVGDKMRIYGEATGNDPWVSIHDGDWHNYAGCVVTSPYTDIVVTQDMINTMTIKTLLWGKFCKVTKICKVVTTTN